MFDPELELNQVKSNSVLKKSKYYRQNKFCQTYRVKVVYVICMCLYRYRNLIQFNQLLEVWELAWTMRQVGVLEICWYGGLG